MRGKGRWSVSYRVLQIRLVLQDGRAAGQTLGEEDGLLLGVTTHTDNGTASSCFDIGEQVQEGRVDVCSGGISDSGITGFGKPSSPILSDFDHQSAWNHNA
jgi:hypothetical protein